jgi:hypothetical protein
MCQLHDGTGWRPDQPRPINVADTPSTPTLCLSRNQSSINASVTENRFAILFNWFWSYLTWGGGIRLITGAAAQDSEPTAK